MFMAEELAAGLVVDGAILAPLGATRLFVSSYSQFLRTKEIFNLLLHYLHVTPRSKRIGVLLHPLGKCTLQESCWIRIAKTM